MKLHIEKGDAVLLGHEHFKAGSTGVKSMKIDTLPSEGVILHRGKALQEPGVVVSGVDLMIGELVYMPAPNQSGEAVLNYTLTSRVGSERRDYLFFDSASTESSI